MSVKKYKIFRLVSFLLVFFNFSLYFSSVIAASISSPVDDNTNGFVGEKTYPSNLIKNLIKKKDLVKKESPASNKINTCKADPVDGDLVVKFPSDISNQGVSDNLQKYLRPAVSVSVLTASIKSLFEKSDFVKQNNGGEMTPEQAIAFTIFNTLGNTLPSSLLATAIISPLSISGYVEIKYPAVNLNKKNKDALAKLSGQTFHSPPIVSRNRGDNTSIVLTTDIEFNSNRKVCAFFTPNDAHFPPTKGGWGQDFPDLWGLKNIKAEQAWDITKGAGQVVAVIDTGVDYNHPELVNKVIKGHDYINNDEDPMDDMGHGTHVAGTIAAIANNNIGIAGVAPDAKILAIKVLNSSGSGNFTSIASAIVEAADKGASVINMSLGGYFGLNDPEPSYLSDAIKYAHDKGTVIVVAAGNSNNDTIGYYPANDPNVITVSAFDHNDAKAYFSNFGQKIAVAAPGGGDVDPTNAFQPYRSILSLKASQAGDSITGNGQLIVDTNYVRQAGTSMASPHVAGVAALVKASHPSFSVEQVRQVIEQSSDDIAPVGFDINAGYGRVNAFRAVFNSVTPLEVQITSPFGNPTLTSSVIPVIGTVSGSNLQKWVLQWSREGESWNDIVSGTSSVNSNQLGVWDISNLPSGGFVILRLLATDTNDQTFEYREEVFVEPFFITSPISGPSNSDPTPFRGGAKIEIKGTIAINNSNLNSYSAAIYKMSSSGNLIQPPLSSPKIILGTPKIINGTLATWDTTSVETGVYSIQLSIKRNTDTSPTIREILVIVDPTIHSGWPINLSALEQPQKGNVGLAPDISFSLSFMDHLIASDINGDGKDDLLMAYQNTVSILDGDGHQLPGWPKFTNGTVQKTPSVGDIDGDGKPEIIIADNKGSVYVWDRNGILLTGWPKSFRGGFYPVAVSDINNDGRDDIITADKYNSISIIDSNGNELPGWPKQLTYPLGSITVGDLDNDGRKEIFVLTDSKYNNGNYTAYLFTDNGLLAPGWPKDFLGAGTSPTYPVIADINNDNSKEIIWGNGHLVYAFQGFQGNGAAVTGWPKTLAGGNIGSVIISDIDGPITGNYNPEIIVSTQTFYNSNNSTNNENLYALHDDGALLSGWPITLSGFNWTFFGYGTPAVADINNDGVSEVIISSDRLPSYQSLHAYAVDGTEISTFPKFVSALGPSNTFSPVVADFDGDGLLKMAWADYNKNIYMYDLNTPVNSLRPWPMYRHDAKLTGTLSTTLKSKPPIISNITINPILDTSGQINWSTDKLSTSQVEYGLTANYGQSTSIDSTLTKSHSLGIYGLAPATFYHFRLKSADKDGNLTVSPDQSFTTLVSPLIFYWKFDDTNPSAPPALSADYSGHNLRGTVKSGVGSTTDHAPLPNTANPSSFSFSGVNSAVEAYLVNSVIPVNGDFTATLWFKGGKPANTKMLMNLTGATYSKPQVKIGMTSAGKISLLSGASSKTITGANVKSDNKWHFVAVKRNTKEIPAYRYAFFLDGALVGTSSEVASVSPFNFIEIGHTNNTSYPKSYFIGNIDDVRLYNRALDNSEIRFLYSSSSVPPPPQPGE